MSSKKPSRTTNDETRKTQKQIQPHQDPCSRPTGALHKATEGTRDYFSDQQLAADPGMNAEDVRRSGWSSFAGEHHHRAQ